LSVVDSPSMEPVGEVYRLSCGGGTRGSLSDNMTPRARDDGRVSRMRGLCFRAGDVAQTRR